MRGPWLALLLSGLVGCVRAYQPMSGLHDPVVVDPRAQNLRDVHLTVYCVPEDLLTIPTASTLCRKVGLLFENQGAQVTTTVGGDADDAVGDDAEDADGEPAEKRTDLTLELRARKVHESFHPISWILNVVSFTIVPGILESTFAQDVVVRDGNGFLLVTDSLEGRVIESFGVGPWLGNAILDLTVRGEEDEITGNKAERELSEDLYRQLSQSVFDARMQWQVLREASPSARGSQGP